MKTSGPRRSSSETETSWLSLLCCWRCGICAKLPRTGYCVTNGDIIPLSVNVQNNNTRTIKMKARIFRQVLLFSQGHKHVSKKSVPRYPVNPSNQVPRTHGIRQIGLCLHLNLPYEDQGSFMLNMYWRYLLSYHTPSI